MKRVLHVGCGLFNPQKLHHWFRTKEWQEVRLDIDPEVSPDVVASITDMSVVESFSYDALYSSHNLEHLYPHEVPVALGEFVRVLRPDGYALITCPDLQAVALHVAKGRLEEVLYNSPAGPISPIDILYGHRASMERGNIFMAHRTGFTAHSLGKAITKAGFAQARVQRASGYNLWAVAYRTKPEGEGLGSPLNTGSSASPIG